MSEHENSDEAMPKTEPGAPVKKAVEVWEKELGTPAWLFAGAKHGHRWPIGLELTEEAYREALDAAANVVCR